MTMDAMPWNGCARCGACYRRKRAGRGQYHRRRAETVAGEPYYDERTKRTISGGWFGLLPRLEAILPPDHAGLAGLQAARDACNAERDAYLR